MNNTGFLNLMIIKGYTFTNLTPQTGTRLARDKFSSHNENNVRSPIPAIDYINIQINIRQPN